MSSKGARPHYVAFAPSSKFSKHILFCSSQSSSPSRRGEKNGDHPTLTPSWVKPLIQPGSHGKKGQKPGVLQDPQHPRCLSGSVTEPGAVTRPPASLPGLGNVEQQRSRVSLT